MSLSKKLKLYKIFCFIGYVSLFIIILVFSINSNHSDTITKIQTIEINNHDYAYCDNCKDIEKLTSYKNNTYYIQDNEAYKIKYCCSKCGKALYFEIDILNKEGYY